MTNDQHDIEKYLRGELTPAEMHALEKRALTDPFLADALEGLEPITTDDLSADVADLRGRLDARIHDRKRNITPWGWTLRIAAGLLILAISTYFIISLNRENNRLHDLALNKETENIPETSKPEPDKKVIIESEINTQQAPAAEKKEMIEKMENREPSPAYLKNKTIPDEISGQEIASEEILAEQKPTEKKRADDEAKGTALPVYDSIPANAADEISKSLPLASVIPEQEKAKSRLADTPVEARASKKDETKEDKKQLKVVRGTVTDAEDGTVLPGVNVTVKGTSIGTTTDENGNFKISLDDVNAALVFSFIGLQNVEVPVNNQDRLNVSMSADYASLNEVVVVGYGENDSNVIKEDEPNVYSFAEPLGGRKAFKNYLAQNIRYPQQAIENSIEGKVTIQFMVETSGVLDDFKVVKGIGYGCDEEVIRRIKQGPTWSPSKRNDIPYRGRVKVRYRFKLPN